MPFMKTRATNQAVGELNFTADLVAIERLNNRTFNYLQNQGRRNPGLRAAR